MKLGDLISYKSLTRIELTNRARNTVNRRAFLVSFLLRVGFTIVVDVWAVAVKLEHRFSTSTTRFSLPFTLSNLLISLPFRTTSEIVVCCFSDFRLFFFKQRLWALSAFLAQSTRRMYTTWRMNRITAIAEWPIQNPLFDWFIYLRDLYKNH